MSSKVRQAINDDFIYGIVERYADKISAAVRECGRGSFVSIEVHVDSLSHPVNIMRLNIGHSTAEQIGAFTDDVEGVRRAFALARRCGDQAAFWAVRDDTRGTLMVRSLRASSGPCRGTANRPSQGTPPHAA